MLYYHEALFIPRAAAVQKAEGLGNGYLFGNDLYQIWITARELRHGRDPYAPTITRQIQTGLYGRPLDAHRPGDPVDQRAFPYPAYVDVLFWPVGEFSFPGTRLVFVCLLVVLAAASVMLWLRALDWQLEPKWIAAGVLLTLCSYPALEGLFAAQLGMVVFFLVSAAALALVENRYLAAGIMMGLSTVKPQVSVLVICYLVVWAMREWRTRYRFCVGFAFTVAALMGSSLLLVPHWIPSWTRTLLAYRQYNPPPLATQLLMPVPGGELTVSVSLILTSVAVLSAVALAWRNRATKLGSTQFWLTWNVLLAITVIFVLPGQAVYDHIILLPGILWAAQHRGTLRKAGPIPRLLLAVSGIILFWPWLSAFLLIVLRPFVSTALFYSAPVFALPIRAAVPLPFAILALLTWTWRSPSVWQAASQKAGCSSMPEVWLDDAPQDTKPTVA